MTRYTSRAHPNTWKNLAHANSLIRASSTALTTRERGRDGQDGGRDQGARMIDVRGHVDATHHDQRQRQRGQLVDRWEVRLPLVDLVEGPAGWVSPVARATMAGQEGHDHERGDLHQAGDPGRVDEIRIRRPTRSPSGLGFLSSKSTERFAGSSRPSAMIAMMPTTMYDATSQAWLF